MPYRTYAWMGSDGSEIGTVATELFREQKKQPHPLSSRQDRRRVIDSAKRLMEELQIERDEQYRSLLQSSRALSVSPRAASAATAAPMTMTATHSEDPTPPKVSRFAEPNPLASTASSHEYQVEEEDASTAVTTKYDLESRDEGSQQQREEASHPDVELSSNHPTDDAYSPEFQVCTADDVSESNIADSSARRAASVIHFDSDDEH
ncbi:Hypothetical protein, putative [Bodo saltans]|uniref:Uncharacterized protein n=1 Tax=Bodo saltans TaxID=75058 RepID=A0A0S4IRG6_BODSA|nr:Hypothetical protein, putative [Bodo saltans]|eukprot:CUG02061.1 Hypothetical protein, putative [Bodo saltans]